MIISYLTSWLYLLLGNGFLSAEHEDGGWDRNRGYGRGRGRARGRGFRGRGRGGYNGPQVDAQPDMGGYNQEPPFQGRGNVSFNLFIIVICLCTKVALLYCSSWLFMYCHQQQLQCSFNCLV